MRSEPPFFLDHLTDATIDAIADIEGPLTLYCGAGATIDRTGHSWASLILAAFPKRRRPDGSAQPVQAQLRRLRHESSEQLASSLVYLLREAAGPSRTLRDALRTRLKAALYGNPSRWQRGQLLSWLVLLAFFRAEQGRSTRILTTNYDDYIEAHYDDTRAALEDTTAKIPGMRVSRPGQGLLNSHEPVRLDRDATGAYIDLVYLHGRLPRSGRVSWPLVLDENSYSSTAAVVEAEVAAAFRDSDFVLLVGTSVRDTPLVRALSSTRTDGGQRVALLGRGQFAHERDELESLNLLLARQRASELGFTPLFPDFNGQVAQFVTELALKTALGEGATHYMDRLDRWWSGWVEANGDDLDIPRKLRDILTGILPLIDCGDPSGPLEEPGERYQLELWVRADPVSSARSLTRWARSMDAHTAGVSGKSSALVRGSYLAPIRTFTEGRPGRFDISDLESGRESADRYTWRSFLCVPIRHQFCTVGVLSLASTLPLSTASMSSSEEATEKVLQVLRAEGSALLAVGE